MARHPYLFSKNGIYYHRQRVSSSLLVIMVHKELKRSLKTTDIQIARRRLITACRYAEELFVAIKQRRDHMTPELENALIQKIYHREISEDDATWKFSHGMNQSQVENLKQSHEDFVAELIGSLNQRDYSLVREDVRAHCTEHNLNLESDSAEFHSLCKLVLRAGLESYKTLVKRMTGDWSDAIGDARINEALHIPMTQPNQRPQPQVPSKKEPDTKTLIDKYIAEQKKALGANIGRSWGKTEKETRQNLHWFWDFLGNDISVNDISKSDVVSYKDALLHTPANYRKFFKNKTMKQAIKANATVARPTLSIKTINNKKLMPLIQFFEWCVNNGYMKENYARGISIKQSSKAKNATNREPFSIDALNAIFRSPLYTGCKSQTSTSEAGGTIIEDHRKWMPLLALFTGARMGELAQLETTDIKQIDNVWIIHITDNKSVFSTNVQKSLKNSQSERQIPIHPELIKLGFLSYFEKIKASKSQRLFPKCQLGSDNAFSPYSKEFGRFLKSTGIKKAGIVFHSFRHNMEDAMRDAGLEEGMQFALMGRADRHSSAGYGRGFNADTMHKAIAGVQYDGLDLRHLYVK